MKWKSTLKSEKVHYLRNSVSTTLAREATFKTHKTLQAYGFKAPGK